jgi:hypothetical protein
MSQNLENRRFSPVLLVALLAPLAGCEAAAPDLEAQARAVTIDPVQACPVPSPEAIPGHESVFYLCAEAVVRDGAGCGPDGYLLGYGTRYSQRFYKEARPRMSSRGQRWIDDVLVCLQRDLRDAIDVETSCEDIRTIAFDSHPQCYVEAGFCALPVWDVLTVVWTIDASDWLGSSAARQAVRTALGCGHEYARWLRFFFAHLT